MTNDRRSKEYRMTERREVDWEKIGGIIDKHKDQRWSLIPLLQEIQEAFGYVPPESIEPIAEALNVFPSQVQGVITFYAGFSLEPKGKYVLKVCRGTACHVKGGRSILRLIKRELEL
jgi:NADH:ubiquinone oxidoreductase subunit E